MRIKILLDGSLLSGWVVLNIVESGSGFGSDDSVLGFHVEGITSIFGVCSVVSEDFDEVFVGAGDGHGQKASEDDLRN